MVRASEIIDRVLRLFAPLLRGAPPAIDSLVARRPTSQGGRVTAPRPFAISRLLVAAAGAAPLYTATLAGAEQRGNCGYDSLKINHNNPGELSSACQALADVLRYFQAIGFEITPKVTVTFAEQSGGPQSRAAFTHGQFDAAKAHVLIYPSSSGSAWGLPWRDSIAVSFLRHEFVHVAIWQIASSNARLLRPEWHEFIAYAVQIALMNERLREELLAKHEAVQPFQALTEVNEFTYGMHPETFAVAAYLTYRARGEAAFVRQLLRGEIVPPRVPHPFPHSPD